MAKYQDVNQNGIKGEEVARKARPVPVVLWKNVDVMKWMKRCCADYYNTYGYLFNEHEITGRSLVRLNDISLEKMGIKDRSHRNDIRREILKLKLKSDILEIKDLERSGVEQLKVIQQGKS